MNPKLNVVLAIATILGGIAAIWFFWDKIRPFIFGQAKPPAKKVINGPDAQRSSESDSLAKVEKLMPNLLAEMRADLADNPLCREFILLERGWIYNHQGNTLVYYFDDHPKLKNEIRILENHGLVKDIKYKKVARYVLGEEFVEYLLRT
ncbi:MAG TPA: hypothetical protein VK582_03705 [Pyrinomonadaceae bacterium]|nr:hypothetical protein [Pyrinomonadaceae bacterium]